MTPEDAMQFMVWSSFYHDITPEKNVCYSKCGKFFALKAKRPKAELSVADVKHLDKLKEMLLTYRSSSFAPQQSEQARLHSVWRRFKCFEEQSVFNACKQFQMAKVRHEPCPFPQAALDNMFAKEV